jgi:bifunctional DNase/RNase
MRKETKTMIEFELYDVLVHAVPGGDAPPRLTNERLRIVVLREKGGERVLPIWIGAGEGDALAWHRGGEATPRPLTSDLMASLLETTGGRVESVTISSLREKTFYAVVTWASTAPRRSSTRVRVTRSISRPSRRAHLCG